MSHNVPERDPRSEFEDEGIPNLQDGAPEQEWAVDPQRAPLPADQPVAVDDYGTTVAEQIAGEPLDLRVDREVPEGQAMFGAAGDPVVRPAQQAEPDRSDAADALTPDGGLGPDADLDTEYEQDAGTPADWAAQPEEPSGQVWDDRGPPGAWWRRTRALIPTGRRTPSRARRDLTPTATPPRGRHAGGRRVTDRKDRSWARARRDGVVDDQDPAPDDPDARSGVTAGLNSDGGHVTADGEWSESAEKTRTPAPDGPGIESRGYRGGRIRLRRTASRSNSRCHRPHRGR
jgi:hypothetical protein